MDDDRYTNIFTQSAVDQDGDILAISTLEICDPEFEFVPETTVCTVSNGVGLDPIPDRIQQISFIVDPRSKSFVFRNGCLLEYLIVLRSVQRHTNQSDMLKGGWEFGKCVLANPSFSM